ncbi:MAG: TPM domain-containing protein [Burkholderiales bacterium]|nr:TPM domain-containing protein [Burkholderiales bacterium]
MNLARILKHLFTGPGSVRRVLTPEALAHIEAAIRASEATHRGELRFAAEGALDVPELLRGVGARERAVQVFSDLRVWDTEENNGVLIYLLLAEHDFEIVGDRGIHVHVGAAGWEAIALRMEERFRAGEFERGVLEGMEAITEALRRHFPAQGPNANELPDRPVII